MKQKLDRTLGLYSCLTISIGTMIGSAIFVLAGTSFETAGPSASLSIFLSGIAALFTAFSFAELVTLIPTAGGGYAYVREATDNGVLGFLCGWGFWLGYAMSCGLFALGFGNFLNYFLPFIPNMVGAYGLIFYVLYTNIRGVKDSSKLQNIITTGLILLLFAYIIYGLFFIDTNNFRPFFPKGLNGTFKAMGFLYMTYIGYGLITTASEEVVDPEKTIPKAIIISVLVVIFIKTATFFVGSGIINWQLLVPGKTSTPMIDTAIAIAGHIGGYLFAFAGILATLSSINTAVLASSRTSFALSRDRRFPAVFKSINKHTKTPVYAVIATGIIVFIATSIKDLEHISTVTSIFSLTGYSLVNVAVMIFRKKYPDAKRKFKVPLYPITPALGIGINFFMVIQLMMADLFALTMAVIILGLGLLYYYVGLPKLSKAPKGITPHVIPKINIVNNEDKKEKQCNNVVVALAHPEHVKPLTELAVGIAHLENGTVTPVHVVEVPEAIPLDSRYRDLRENMDYYEKILSEINDYTDETTKKLEPLLLLSRNKVHAINSLTKEENACFTLMGWHRSGLAYNMLGGLVPEILKTNESTVGILNPKGSMRIKKILYPYGGGIYSQGAAKTVKRIAKSFGAKVTLLRIVKDEIKEQELKEMERIMRESLNELGVSGETLIIQGKSVRETIIEMSDEFDLIILGVSSEWGFRESVTGLKSDEIAERAKCSVLVVREFNKPLQNAKIRKLFNRLKRI